MMGKGKKQGAKSREQGAKKVQKWGSAAVS